MYKEKIPVELKNTESMPFKYTNELIHSTSPYLLQHAHNPVNWHPWSEETIQEAKRQDKLILVSIGYAACHWCHVMEHESFEDEAVARIMNENFVCIKVDREERPDVDHYYMTAVQLMQINGGWPLNVVALPDGRPIWGGTYFPKEQWIRSLLAVSGFYRDNREKTEEYAQSLREGIHQTLLSYERDNGTIPDPGLPEKAVRNWKKYFDTIHGGRKGAPKFPMPGNLGFLMDYGFLKNDREVLSFVETSLLKMARGGIYDQLGGGFARYSVDEHWKVPHFEKMLYDNAQLLSLYANGFLLFGNEEMKKVVYETKDFIERELTDPAGAFYSSLDADSEGEEGKFYLWKSSELKEILGDDYTLFARYYQVEKKGRWEKGNNILLREESGEEFAAANGLTVAGLEKILERSRRLLMEERNRRVRPGLDDKTVLSWNALTMLGLTNAYRALHDPAFLELALKNAAFISENLLLPDGSLFHTWKKGISSVKGFLEDYAFAAQAFISLFEITGDQNWLNKAQTLIDYAFYHFFDENSGLFFFIERNSESAVSNYFQKEDNVIPSANSVMADNLFRLYLIMGKPEYKTIATRMLQHVLPQFERYPMAFSNWGKLLLKLTTTHFEVVVCGENAREMTLQLQKKFHPNVLWAFTGKSSHLPVFENRFVQGKTMIYVCREGICNLPVETVAEAEQMLT